MQFLTTADQNKNGLLKKSIFSLYFCGKISVSGVSYEFFLTLGTGDGDLTLASGDSDSLPALGAIKIAVLPVLQPFKELQKLPVLLVSLIGIPGQASEDRPKHQDIGNGPQYQLCNYAGNKGIHQHQHQASAQDRHIQLIVSVAPLHKVAKPCAQSAHRKSPVTLGIYPYYMQRLAAFQLEVSNVYGLFKNFPAVFLVELLAKRRKYGILGKSPPRGDCYHAYQNKETGPPGTDFGNHRSHLRHCVRRYDPAVYSLFFSGGFSRHRVTGS
jgi:hypothetical protein